MTPSRIFTVSITLCMFLVSVSADAVADAKCEDAQIQTCDACIQAHPKCAWCLEGKFNANIKRCRSVDKFDELGDCKDGKVENPISSFTNQQNEDFSKVGQATPGEKVVQLKPQIVNLDMRRGEVMKFNITYRKVSDYPVDLYYVMDLSNSMKDDLQTLQSLGQRLALDIKSSVTQDIQLGFGTFVDKVMMPFASTVPKQLENPCFKNQEGGKCAPPFGFKHQQTISSDLAAFRDAVTNTTISGNIDSPEGGFDALMQIAVCTNEIGWRKESTHLVVFTTDASFHMALDGKLAAILEMNDLQCHMERGANPYLPDDLVYSKSKEQDYPSIGQLKHVFAKYKIQPIFAVTEEVKPLYDGLKDLIPNSHVDQLAVDSSNIIGIIKDAYNKLKGKLEMTWSNKPKEVDIKYRVLCPGEADWKEQSLNCDNIAISSEVVYEFEMTAIECPKGDIAPMTFTSSSLQEAVQITFGFKCGCQCTGTPESNSPACSTNGSLVCGICQCDDQHEGANCQCVRESENVALVEKCKKSTTGEICENNGVCECGNCTCNEGYSATYCECSNKGCPKDGNGLCGGPAKGSCRNCNNDGKCVCRSEQGWELDPKLNTCTCNNKLCVDPDPSTTNETCSGHGTCECNRCVCDASGHWNDVYCQTCTHPDCKDTKPACQGAEGAKYIECTLCVHQSSREKKDCKKKCEEQGVPQKRVNKMPDCSNCHGSDECVRACAEVDSDIKFPEECQAPLPQSDCHIDFRIVWFKQSNEFGVLVKDLNKEDDCDEPINPIIIVLPIIAGIVLLGLLALAAWKIYQTMRDKKEWENFENEMKQSKWTKGQNPIFQKPMTKFQNPTYQGH